MTDSHMKMFVCLGAVSALAIDQAKCTGFHNWSVVERIVSRVVPCVLPASGAASHGQRGLPQPPSCLSVSPCGASGGANPQDRTAPTRNRTTRYSNDGAAGVATAVVASRAW